MLVEIFVLELIQKLRSVRAGFVPIEIRVEQAGRSLEEDSALLEQDIMESPPRDKEALPVRQDIVVGDAAADDMIVEVEFVVLVINRLKHVVPDGGLPVIGAKKTVLAAEPQEIPPTRGLAEPRRSRSSIRPQSQVGVVLLPRREFQPKRAVASARAFESGQKLAAWSHER